MSRSPDQQGGAAGGRPLPPRIDPRAGRAPRPGTPRAGRTRGASAALIPRFGRVLGLTTLGAVVPGTALIAAGARRAGSLVLALAVVALGTLAFLATAGRRTAVHWVVDPTALLLLAAGAVAVAVVWSLLIIAGYRMLAPLSTTRSQHVVGTLVVAALAVGVSVPAFEVAHLATVQRSLIQNLFADGRSATVDPGGTGNPLGDRERVNVLLLGGDGGEGRDGVRTDTVMVASIEQNTGATTLFSLPRNLEELPFPEDSPLHDVYPDGFWDGSESESLLNAVYRNGPAAHPDILGPTDNPGADFLKLGIGEALGMTIDYYVLVNLDGFSEIVDALGGITVNVNYYVPIGGEPTIGILPDDYIPPGPDQHMDGTRALHYARGRFGLDDYLRMDRQRCMINAIVDADPMTLLTQYPRIAATTQDILMTDIPQSALGAFAELALRIKGAGITSVVFDRTAITPAHPDYDAIRRLVREALDAPAAAPPGVDDTPSPLPDAPTPSAPEPEAGAAADGPAAAPTDPCAYDPAQAAAARAEGEPPTRRP